MTEPAKVFEAILEQRVLVVVRLADSEEAVAASRILAQAGIRALEISLSQPDACAAITAASTELAATTFVGAGTVRTAEQAAAAVDAGASFLVSPALDEATAAWARAHDVPYIPGALTPGEVEAASRWSTLVKLFPARCFGPSYVRDLQAPFPEVALVPTGGVAPENAQEYLAAGAVAVAVGSSLVDSAATAKPEQLARRTRQLLEATQKTRRQ
jgi:2-dehydro-3-deoxyphosphogluconate aldolase / (4S)-4-hydroxy-2-oxoglutarate aldolase